MPISTPITSARKNTGKIAKCEMRQASAAQTKTVITATMMPSSASCAHVGGSGGVQHSTPWRKPSNSPTKAPEMRPNQRQSFVFIAASRVKQDRETDTTEIAAADGGENVDRGTDKRSGWGRR